MKNLRERLRYVIPIKKTKDFMFNFHVPNEKPDVFLLSTPRSGSTWLMELIGTQPGFKYCSEPFNLRDKYVCQKLGIKEWEELYNPKNLDKIKKYLNKFCNGELKFKNPTPFFSKNWRFFTNRIVFKIIHNCEDKLSLLNEFFTGEVVYLIRHPIAVTLSRKVYPRIEAFIKSHYRKNFSSKQIKKAETIIRTGTNLEKGVLSWCLQTSVALSGAIHYNNLIITYEQLVLKPEPAIKKIVKQLDLPKPSLIYENLERPSGTTYKSDKATQEVIKNEYSKKRQWIVEKWREKVNRKEERKAMDILKIFNIGVYESGNFLPNNSFWLK